MFELRPYQKRAVADSIKHLTGRSKKPGIVVLPTGGGKSLIIGGVVRELSSPILILQPSKEILLQNFDKAVGYGLNPTIYSASCGIKELSTLTYATLKSIKKDIEKLKEIGLKYILVDECHSGYSAEKGSEFMKFISEFPDVKVLGFTATPCRLHSYSSMLEGNYCKLNILTKDDPTFFTKIVHVTQVKELVDSGFWAKIEYDRWVFDDTGLFLNSTGAEYTQESIKAVIAKSGLNNAIYLRVIDLLGKRNHILVCMDSVESCERISSFINKKMGYISDFVTSTTANGKRDKIIKSFKSGEIRIVFNYSALATGFDFPDLDCVVMGRPTFSFSVFYQFLGRGVRPGNKQTCLFVDCCDNTRKFGMIENLSIEEFPYHGWCMFSEDQLITGIHMGDIVTRNELHMRNEKRKLEIANDESGRRHSSLDGTIMWFGKFEGRAFAEIPMSYFRYLCENMNYDLVDDRKKQIIDYYKEIRI